MFSEEFYYHLSSASVLSGVCDTDCKEFPPILSPLRACFNDEKSTYYYELYYYSSLLFYLLLIPSVKKSSYETSPPKN